MSMESRMAGVEHSLVQIKTTLEENLPKVTKQLYGNGPRDPGMIVRLDRLEQAQCRHNWRMRMVVGIVVTLVIGGLWSILTG